MRKIQIREEVDHLTYSSSSETYILGTSHESDFKLPDDDEVHTEWRNEGSSDSCLTNGRSLTAYQ